jgi:CheY-like chemotaxis protein
MAQRRAIEFHNPLQAFQDLMPFRVQDILLVSSLYDSFTLQEDGRLNELILGEFLELSLHQTPGLTHVSSAREALELAKAERRFNLIVTVPEPGDMDASELARQVKAAGLDVPVVVLAFDNTECKRFMAEHDLSDVEHVYLWQGNARILVAIVKLVEDARNAVHDSRMAGVRVILVVEDTVRYYSSFLPVIYTELIGQSERLLSEGINLSHKLVRMRARPKILHARDFEEAWDLFEIHKPYLLGLITDIEFPAGGEQQPEAGFALARRARAALPELPILLQSGRHKFAEGAYEIGAFFLRKYSDTLHSDLRRFMTEHFAFGDFIFRLPDGTEVGRARDLKELEEMLRTVPAESIGYHGERNHFSNWFTARTEFALARRLRPRRVDQFATLEDLRHDLVESIAEYRREQSETLVADFERHTFDPRSEFFARIGGGSLGGKARGLAFVRYLLRHHRVKQRFPGVRVGVPSAVVLATDTFDRFLADNDLLDFALATQDDDELMRRFLAAPLPDDVTQDLLAFLDGVHWPLAVRSSSLLEDSQYQPFTGVYDTFMLANNQSSLEERLNHLSEAIRRVYASTFSRSAKAYLHATPYRLEEEKMAVILQRVVGAPHGDRYYPDFSGVARSHNFYPVPPLKPEDGVASVALGLGREVVEGGQFLSFCPRAPQHILHFSAVEDILDNSQRQFWALEMKRRDPADGEQAMRETRFGLEVAERDGVLYAVGSTWSPENQAIYDGISRPGVRLVTFAPILKHEVFPLAELLSDLLDIGARGMNRAAEIEFAVRMSSDPSKPHELGFLQMRPLVLSQEFQEIEVEDADPADLICESPRVMGNGRVDGIHDLVVVDFARFDRSQSREAAEHVARFNAHLVAEDRTYLLIGVGRWGSADPWLGIPVSWEQIAGARVIVETGFRDMRVTPSQGSHFFQNLTSFQIGYFTVDPEMGGFIDWDWIASCPAEAEAGAVRHLRFDRGIVMKMDGRSGRGIIYKPGRSPSETG